MKENIFIHIPKTGGTTLNTLIEGTYWQTRPDFYYRHIDAKTKKSNSGDIFNPSKFSEYKNYNVFMMLRDPLDRVVSEYYFLRDRAEFMNLLNPKPKNLKEYVTHPQTPDYVIGFLLGDRIYSKKRPAREDLEKVITAIEEIPIHVAIFEDYPYSLQYFSEITGIKFPKKIEAKRVTLKRPVKEEISEEIKELIKENNRLEYELYEYCLKKFNQIKPKLKKPKYQIVKSPYNHIIPYALKQCIFEFAIDNKLYIRSNLLFFKELNFYILKQLKVRSGEEFLAYWNQTYVNTVNKYFPNTSFAETITNAFNKEDDLLEQVYAIGKAVDEFLLRDRNKKWYQSMKFDKALVQRTPVTAKQFFKKLFKR
ncbi:MAG: hypothetical protein D6707_02060 [Bacteroidetes bacterium]|nr:MAG: hypothetical protein D6707_02060 [Bacteroidota bacterium]